MPVLLQGGAEFGSRCRGMDGDLLALMRERRGHAPSVLVLPLASPSGPQYEATGANAVRYYRSLGAGEVSLAPDPRRGGAVDGAVGSLAQGVDVVVLPGGSPSRLREALHAPLTEPVADATTLADVLHRCAAAGAAISGSSAGAMLLGGLTALPEQHRPGGGPLMTNGVAMVPWAFVVPHWRSWPKAQEWVMAAASQAAEAAQADTRDGAAGAGAAGAGAATTAGGDLAADSPLVALGLPEQSGLLLDTVAGTTRARALGASSVSLVPLPAGDDGGPGGRTTFGKGGWADGAVTLAPLDEEPLERLLGRVRDNQGS